MRDEHPHLRLVPQPLAKCGPPPRDYPRTIDGSTIRRVKREWMLEHTRGGRTINLLFTTNELRDLVADAAELLRRNEGDL